MKSPESLGLVTLVCIVIANMVGAGVFTTSGYSLESLRSPAVVLYAWGCASAVALCGAIGYGELARRLPESGGEYLFLSRNLSPFAGFLTGFISLTAGFSGAIAAAALTFSGYVLPLTGVTEATATAPDSWILKTVAIAAIAACGLGHSFLQRLTTMSQNAVVGIKLVGLIAFAATAAWCLRCHTWHWAGAAESTDSGFPVLAAFSMSVMWISFSFAGFNGAVYVASEARDAGRLVPRALLIGTALVAGVYLLLNLIFVTAAPFDVLAGQHDIAAVAARAIGGRPLEQLIRLTIAVATLSSVAVMIMTGPRVYAKMADDGVFFSSFGSAQGQMHRAVLLQSAIAAFLVSIASIRDMLTYLGSILSLSSALTVATGLWTPVIARRRAVDKSSDPPLERTGLLVRVASVIYVAATLAFVGLMTLNDPFQLRGTVATIAAGTLLWLVVQRQRRSGQRQTV